MPALFGSPSSGLSLDALLAQLGIGGAPGAAPQPYDASGDAGGPGMSAPAPYDASGDAGGPTPLSFGAPAMSDASGFSASTFPPTGAAAPATAPPSAASDPASGLPPIPQWKPRNPVGDVLDRLFLGGAIEGVRGSQFQHQLEAYDLALKQASVSRQLQAIAALPKGQQPLATLAADKFVEGVSKPVTTPEGATTTYFGDPSSRYTAPKIVVDNGRIGEVRDGQYAELGNTGPQLSVTPSGAVADARGILGTGAVNSVPTYEHFARSEKHGFVQPGVGSPGGASGAQAGGAAAAGSPSDQAYLSALGAIESGGNNGARNGSSTGLYQFKPATFAAMGGTNINDPAQQAAAALKLRDTNAAQLQAAGINATPGTLYLAHQQGAAGAKALLSADPSANAVQVLQQSGLYRNSAVARRAITGNGGNAGMSAGDFVGMWNRKFSKAYGRAGGDTSAPAPAGQGGGLGSESLSDGQGFVQNADRTQTSPDGAITAGPRFLRPESLQSVRNSFADSPTVKDATNAVTALNGFISAKAKMTNNGVLDNAAMDSYLRGINPGMGARANSIQAFMDHLGLPQELQGKIQSATGNGFLTPATMNQMEQVMRSYAGGHLAAAAQRKAADEKFVSRYGYSPDDLAEDLPTVQEAPAASRGVPAGLRVSDIDAELARRGHR